MADEELAAESVLIGFSVFNHLGMDTNMILKERRDLFDGPDCSLARSSTSGAGGCLESHLMVARLNLISHASVQPVLSSDK